MIRFPPRLIIVQNRVIDVSPRDFAQIIQLNDVYSLELDGGGDTTASCSLVQCSNPAPEPRWRHVAAALDEEKMVIFGGIGSKSKRLNDVWVLDISSDIPGWVEKAVLGEAPCPRGHHSGTMVDSQVMQSKNIPPFPFCRLLIVVFLKYHKNPYLSYLSHRNSFPIARFSLFLSARFLYRSLSIAIPAPPHSFHLSISP